MNEVDKSRERVLRYCIIVLGLAFLIIGLGLTVGIIYLAYFLASQPDQLAALFAYINAQDDVFIKWLIDGQSDEIKFSPIIMIIFSAIAFSIVIQVIISFITLCVSSGKGLLNTSRNFDQ